MKSHAKEISRQFDEYGAVRIYDDGNKRYMAFADDDEQSECLKSQPAQVQHDYSRVMLLSLLFVAEPKKVLLLGLGGGVLAHALFKANSKTKIAAIEIRPAVIAAASQYFYLPQSKRLRLIEADAFEIMAQSAADCPSGFKRCDIIMTDLYNADGMESRQLDQAFLMACIDRVNDKGCLVINCWKQHRSQSELLDLLLENFAEVWSSTTPDGNWVIIASKAGLQTNGKETRERANKLGQSKF